MNSSLSLYERVGSMFYLLPPSMTTFETVEQVPDYTTEAIPIFIFTILVEAVITFLMWDHDHVPNEKAKKKRLAAPPRLNDAITSLSAGLIQQIIGLLVLPSIYLSAYVYIFENYSIYRLDPTSAVTWIITMLAIDFFYYWFHRAAHEINIIWAAHVVHHSSEEYNQTTALRQSVVQGYFGWAFYLPCAFFLPPPLYVAHKHFNLLYQYWIHTEVVGKLGVLEYVLNTPSHHRVHHGSNRYCIDKNYAGTLIIWDRMFGTFQEEIDGTVVFGLTHPINTFDPIVVQTHHLVHIFKTAWAKKGFWNKVFVFIKGPGWDEGKPRLGLPEDIPEVSYPHTIYNPSTSIKIQLYILVQFVATLLLGLVVLTQHGSISGLLVHGLSLFVIFSLTSTGRMFDRNQSGLYMEIARLAFAILMISSLLSKSLTLFTMTSFLDTVLQSYLTLYGVSLIFVSYLYFSKNPFGVDKQPARRYHSKPLESSKTLEGSKKKK